MARLSAWISNGWCSTPNAIRWGVASSLLFCSCNSLHRRGPQLAITQPHRPAVTQSPNRNWSVGGSKMGTPVIQPVAYSELEAPTPPTLPSRTAATWLSDSQPDTTANVTIGATSSVAPIVDSSVLVDSEPSTITNPAAGMVAPADVIPGNDVPGNDVSPADPVATDLAPIVQGTSEKTHPGTGVQATIDDAGVPVDGVEMGVISEGTGIVESTPFTADADTIPQPMCACQYSAGWRPPGIGGTWPQDEYLCDGGDRFGTVEVHANGQLVGVDQQDTVAHMRTRQGDERVVPSNCICVYAPRFASVRHLAGIQGSDQHFRLGTIDRPEETIEHIQRDGAEIANQPNGPRENLVLQPPIEALQLDEGDEIIERRKLAENTFDLRVLQHLDLLGAREKLDRQKLGIENAALAAIEWTDNTAVQIMIKEEPALAEVSYLPTEQIYQYTIPPGRPCLKLVKLASRGHAQPGEEIEFLLQFRNTSPDTLEELTLVDNLTTRLAYIPDSQECSLEATFAADDNTADSHVLRWTLKKPLRSGEGGVIHFRCTVR